MPRPISFLLFLSLFILSASEIYAQSQNDIHGKITDASSKLPAELVTVVLRNVADNKVVMQQVSGSDGSFRFSKVKAGRYFIQASLVGYLETKTEVLNIDAAYPSKKIDVVLQPDKKLLNEVQVSAKKALFSNAIDRKIYNVDMDLMAKSGSASEVLQNVPLVQVDVDGNVSLRNSAATILINGKVSPLMGKNSAAALQQLPAGNIERIEVITNPSAKYKPDGTGGIINIVLKKNTKQGLNGTLTANAGNSERYNASGFLNYNPGKLNVFGSYAIRQDDRLRSTVNDRVQTNRETGAVNNYSDRMSSVSRPFSNTATLGFDYVINDKNSLGISGNYYLRNMTKNDLTLKTVSGTTGIIQDYDRKRHDFEREKNLDATLFYEHGFKKADHKIRAEFNISHSPETEDNHYTNTFRFPAVSDQRDNTLIKQTSDNKNLNIGYENPVSEFIKLEAGYDGQYNRQDLDFYGEVFDNGKQQFIRDSNKTNRFIYNENIHAFYGTYSQELKKFGVMIGLRAEYSDITSHLVNTAASIPSHYFKLYPTLHLSYKLNENQELQLNYSRRVRRPEGDELNPFAEYADPSNVRVGNPYLLPEIIHSIEAGYLWKTGGLSILPGVYYRYTYNRFTSITEPLNDSVLVTRQQNLANDRAFGADVVVSGNLNDKITLSFTPNLFYNQIDASNLGFGTKKSTLTWSANLNSGYTITTGTAVQVSSVYKSSRLTPQGKYLPSFVMNFGIRQEVLKKRGSLYFTASDLFRSQRQEAELQGPFLIQHVLTKSNSRIFYLGMSYNFGVVKKKKDLQFDNSL